MAVSGSGRIVIIKRDGHQGSCYPVVTGNLTIGSGKDCDIIISSKGFPPKQCIITVNPTEATIKNLSSETPAALNGKSFNVKALKHCDKITLGVAKFRWDYDNQINTPSVKKTSDKKAVVVVKRTRNSFVKRKTEPNLRKKIEPLETRGRNSVGSLQGAYSSKTRQIAVVMPQRRCSNVIDNTVHILATPGPSQNRAARSELYNSTAKILIRRITNPLYDSDSRSTQSSGKRKKVDKVEKLDTPVVLDKNKRAALMLLTRRSLSSKKMSNSFNNATSSKSTPNTKMTLTNGSKSLPSKASIARQLLDDQMSKTSAKFSSRHSLLDRRSQKGSILMKYSTERHNVSGVEAIVSESPKPQVEKSSSKTPKTPLLPKVILENKESVKRLTVSRKSRSTPSIKSDSLKKKAIVKAAPTPKLTSKDMTLLLSNSIRTRSFTPKTPILPAFTKDTPKSNIKSKNKVLKSVENSANVSNKNASMHNDVSSFISYLTNALNIMNNPEIDLESVTKTPEFKAISDKIKSVEKLVNTPFAKTPSPQLLEIGRRSRSSKITPQIVIASSPIISPKHSSPKPTDAESTNYIDINTPNLSTLFELKSSTPNDVQTPVLGNISPKTRRSSRKSIGVLNLKQSQILKSKSKTEPKRRINLRNECHSFSNIPRTRRSKETNVEHVSDSSNVTDVNVTSNDDDKLVITPKSSLKPPQEILKEKHSTAKKPISKKNIIDHLIRSPEVAKELFKSPVKRILSQSIRQYSDSHVFDDEQDGSFERDSSFELLTRSSTTSGKSNANSNFEPTTTPADDKVIKKDWSANKNPSKNTTRRLLRTPKSPKNDLRDVKGVKRVFKTPMNQKSPLNDLRNVRGLRRIFGLPEKSPLNDLSDVEGVKMLFSSKSTTSLDNLVDSNRCKRLSVAIQKCDIAPLSINLSKNSQGITKVLKTPTPTKIEKSKMNDSKNLRGVKRLLRTPNIKSSPKNDLRDVRGVRRLLQTPNKTAKALQNLSDNVSGVEKLFELSKNDSCVEEKDLSDSCHQPFNSVLSHSMDNINSRDSVLANVGLIPKKFYHTLKSGECSTADVKTSTTPDRSRRQATIDKTNFSMEVAKVNLSVKLSAEIADNTNVSILCHSTPAVGKSKIGKESKIDVKQISPIVCEPKLDVLPVRGRMLRQRNLVRNLTKISPKKTKTGVKKIKIESIQVKKEPQTSIAVGDGISTKTLRSRFKTVNVKKNEEIAKVIKHEIDVIDLKTPINISTEAKKNARNKKKVTFAPSAEKSLDVPKATRSSKLTVTVGAKNAAKTTEKSSTVKKVNVPGKATALKLKATTSAKVSPKRKDKKANVLKVKLPTKNRKETTPLKSKTSTVKRQLSAQNKKESVVEKPKNDEKKVSKIKKSPIKKSPIARRSTRTTAAAKKA